MKNNSEVKDIIIAWLGISLCFAIAIGGYSISNIISKKANFSGIVVFLIISLVITATSFILHELSHKYTAIHFGAKARFIVWPKSIVFSIFLAIITGFVMVAPGAVYIFGKRLSIKENGLVSLAGPLLNIIMGVFFVILGNLEFLQNIPLLGIITSYGIFINFWIGLFNLIPFGPLDGRKIFLWNPFIWAIMLILPILFLFVL